MQHLQKLLEDLLNWEYLDSVSANAFCDWANATAGVLLLLVLTQLSLWPSPTPLQLLVAILLGIVTPNIYVATPALLPLESEAKQDVIRLIPDVVGCTPQELVLTKDYILSGPLSALKAAGGEFLSTHATAFLLWYLWPTWAGRAAAVIVGLLHIIAWVRAHDSNDFNFGKYCDGILMLILGFVWSPIASVVYHFVYDTFTPTTLVCVKYLAEWHLLRKETN